MRHRTKCFAARAALQAQHNGTRERLLLTHPSGSLRRELVGPRAKNVPLKSDINSCRGERMSKLVAPRDLHCFATCGRVPVDSRSHHAQSHAGAQHCWCVPEVWKTCVKCRDLRKAQVIQQPEHA